MADRVSRLPYLLLGLMTIATFGGPVVIGLVLRGGSSPNWPPDRGVEWWTLGIVSGAVVVLMAACVGIGLASIGKLRSGTGKEGLDRRGVGDVSR